jgi:hypothetical protein
MPTQVSNLNKYWAVVMWMYDVTDGGVLKYKPSIAHQEGVRWCFRESEAVLYGLSLIKNSQRSNLHGLPTFIVKVIKSATKPDVTVDSPLRLFVQPIPVNSD